MTFCPKCGTQVPDGAVFCTSCGSPVGATGGQQAPISGISALSKDTVAQEYWVKRFLAFLIDAIIVYVVLGVVAAAATIPAFVAGLFVPGSSPRIFPFGTFFGVFASVILVLYFTFAEANYGKTIGKEIMKMKVTTDSGGKPQVVDSLLRNLSKIYWVLLLLDVVIGLATETGYKQKFSDRYLKTTVSLA